ncbi:mechanosensitive ion channel family protein [Dactylosporangium sp. CA-092794]|uniref:mechanosensitive ion channel family protein n=1 Tax=Dactylosporangium sp. CA-092794 TaxID=3239929 RepID=UPI003D909BA4
MGRRHEHAAVLRELPPAAWPAHLRGNSGLPGPRANLELVQAVADVAPPDTLDALRVIELRVRPDFRRTVVFGAIALAALIAGHDIGGVHAEELRVRLIAYGCGLLTAISGFAATRTAAREVQRIAVARAGAVAGTPLRLFVLLGGYLITALAVCDLLGVQLRQLLVGGAITGIVVGLAAQPVLGNLFAGLVLLFARPYVPGQQVRVMSGAINGPHVGVIVSAGLLYTMLETADGPLNIPNSALLAAAVGPAPKDAEPGQAAAADVPPVQDGAALATVIAGAESGEERKH